MKEKPLEFEKPIYELYEKLEKLQQSANTDIKTVKDETGIIKERLDILKKNIYK